MAQPTGFVDAIQPLPAAMAKRDCLAARSAAEAETSASMNSSALDAGAVMSRAAGLRPQ